MGGRCRTPSIASAVEQRERLREDTKSIVVASEGGGALLSWTLVVDYRLALTQVPRMRLRAWMSSAGC